MVILAVDYGDTRTGVAVCDKLEMLATGVKVITEKNSEVLAEAIACEIKSHGAELAVVGIPKNMDGSLGFRADACMQFAELLREKSGVSVEMWDERLTTVSAHAVLSELNVRGKKRKQTVDALSAEIILQNFIDSRKNRTL